MIILSTGLVNHLLVTNSLRAFLHGAFPKFYNGTVPTDADQALNGTLLWAPDDGAAGGIAMDAAVTGKALRQNSATPLNKAAAASGTTTYARIVGAGDTGALSTTEKRIQGLAGLAGDSPVPDFRLTSKTFTVSVTPANALQYGSIGLPDIYAPGFSTGLVKHLLITGSLKAALDNMTLKIYNGTVPTNADQAISGDSTLLVTISVGGVGTGVTFEATPVAGALVKTAAETWQGTVGNAGTATYARLVASGDTGALSTTELRYQMGVGVVGEGKAIELTDPTLVLSSVLPFPNFEVKLLKQAVLQS